MAKIGYTYTRKLQEQNIGGNKYESSEHGFWIEEELENPTEAEYQKKSAYLMSLCKAFVGTSIGEREKEIKKLNKEKDLVEDMNPPEGQNPF